MNFLSFVFILTAGSFLLGVSRQWAPLPFLIGATYITLDQGLEIGPFHFTIIRMLILTGIVRVLVRGERLSGGWIALDWVTLFWGIWAILSSYFHEEFSSALINRMGLVYDGWGLYFLLRIFIQDLNGVSALSRIIIILLVPVALEMLLESVTGKNYFSLLGGVGASPETRNGAIRAQGPFAHSILAGTVGAVCLPLPILFWRTKRMLALIGVAAAVLIIFSSRSSGPIMTGFFVLGGLAAWRVRNHMRLVRWGALCGVLALSVVMKAPVYYLIARVDLTGSSTGYHRAALIESSIQHLSEWWMGGTDYTRGWMPTGVGWSEKHTDITNHYLKMGVIGGMPLMLLFISIIVIGFVSVGKAIRLNRDQRWQQQFLLWTLGAILFGHAATMISVSYYDQSIVFVDLVLAAIGSAAATAGMNSRKARRASLARPNPTEVAFAHERSFYCHC